MRYFLLIIILFFGLFSCHKNDEDIFVELSIDEEYLIGIAKEFYSEINLIQSQENANIHSRKIIDWQSNIFKISKDKQNIFVPLNIQRKAEYKKLYVQRFVQFTISDSKVIKAQEIEILSYFNNSNQNLEFLSGFFSRNADGFIIIEDLISNKNSKKIKTITNGIVNENLKIQIHQKINQSHRTSCIDWYLITYWPDGSTSEEYMYTTCEDCEATCIDAGGGPGGGDQNPSTIDSTNRELLNQIILDTNLSEDQLELLSNILSEVLSINCGTQSMFSELTSSGIKISFYMNVNNQSPGSYNPVNKSISFSSTGAINKNVVFEELFHVFQDKFYNGGISQYLNNGKSNIEFEAKLLRDILALLMQDDHLIISTFSGSNDFNTYVNYFSWLESITNNFNNYPSPNNDFNSAYFYWLEAFKESNPLYNFPTTNLHPEAMFQIFNYSTENDCD